MPDTISDDDWQWSGPIDITASRSLSFSLNRKGNNPHMNLQDADGQDCLFIKLDIVKVKSTFFLSFIIMSSENYSYMLRNDTYNYLIKYKQKVMHNPMYPSMSLTISDNPELLLLKETCKPYAWVYPNMKPELEVSFLHMTETIQSETFTFNLDTIIETRDIELKRASSHKTFHIKVRTVIHGPTRVLHFYEQREQADPGEEFKEIRDSVIVGDKVRRLSSMLIMRKKRDRTLIRSQRNLGNLIENTCNEKKDLKFKNFAGKSFILDGNNEDNINRTSHLNNKSMKSMKSIILGSHKYGRSTMERGISSYITDKSYRKGSINADEEEADVGEEPENKKERMSLMILIDFKEIGISLIARNKQKQLVEMNYIQIKGLEFLLMEENTFKTFQIRVKYMNIDNNSDYGTLIPVVFTPTLKRSLLETREKYFFDFCVKYNHNSKEVIYIHI